MDIVILSELVQERGWQISKKRHGHHLLEHTLKSQTASLIIPTCSSEQVPAGTLNAILRLAHDRKTTHLYHWTSFVKDTKNIDVILEKQADGLWGRIEIFGLLIATRGCTVDCVTNSLRTLLIEFAVEETPSCCPAIASVPFVPVYDTTAVWTIIKQLKATYIAEQVGIDTELIGQFMTGNTHPCSELATRLERSIHELGRQLMQVSIR